MDVIVEKIELFPFAGVKVPVTGPPAPTVTVAFVPLDIKRGVSVDEFLPEVSEA